MPVYVYECDNGHSFDDEQPMPGQALKTCPICGKMGSRVIQNVGFILRGEGFHDNDYGPYGRKDKR